MHLRETALHTSKIPWCGYMYRYMCDGTMGMGLDGQLGGTDSWEELCM